ncbi:MAG: DinB family protein [Chloroflexota bacterium]
MSERAEILADWVDDARGMIERTLARTPEATLHWRPGRETNSTSDTVWHVARWLDLVATWLRGAAPESQHWIVDGWAERTGYDPRGLGTDGLGAISGYTFAEVEAIPQLRSDQLLAYLAAVCDDVVPRLRAADDVAARRYAGVIQGIFAHVGEIAAIRTLHERQTAEQH